MKSVQVVHISGKFHLYGICSSRVFRLSNVFGPAETIILDCFCVVFGQASPKCCQICFKFWSLMQFNMIRPIYSDFIVVLRNSQTEPKK